MTSCLEWTPSSRHARVTASVARYNELAHGGKDTDFSKVPTRLFPVENPPFYAVSFGDSGMLVLIGGIDCDAQCRALDAEKNPVPGLFVAGNTMGGRFLVDYPVTVAGASHSMAMSFGRLAGRVAGPLSCERGPFYNEAMEQRFDIFEKFIHADWFNSLIGAAIIFAITFVVCRITVYFARRLLNRTSLLPSSSIFINVIRATVWLIGIGFVLSLCFNVNVNGMITGLGVVGIAISLGFQDTLSNLIGGLQVSLSRSVEPGDNIRMGSSGVTGVVKDVTWRYTTVVDSSGNHTNIPNAVMTSTAVTRLAPLNSVSIALIVTTNSERLTATAHHIEHGFQGTLSFTIADASKAGNATDAAIRAIAPYVHNHLVEEEIDSLSAPAEANAGRPAAVEREPIEMPQA